MPFCPRLTWLEEDVVGQLHASKLERLHRGEEVIDLAMINPDLPPARPLLDKLLEAAVRPTQHRYAVARGIRKLREAFAEKYLGRWQVSLDPEREVCVTMGSKDALEHLLQCVGKDNDVVLVGAPVYPAFLSAINLARLRPYYFPISSDPEQMLAAIERALQKSQAKILLLNFPNNPSGVAVDRTFYDKLADLVAASDVLVINDFVYGEMMYDHSLGQSMLTSERLRRQAVEIYSLSKAYNVPGWRVGALVGVADVVKTLAALKAHVDYGIFLPLQNAACAALSGEGAGALSLIENTVNHYRERAETLLRGLHAHGWSGAIGAAGCSVWARMPDDLPEQDALQFCHRLLREQGVAALPGHAFVPLNSSQRDLLAECGETEMHAWQRSVRFALVVSLDRMREVALRVGAMGNSAPRIQTQEGRC